MDALPLEEKTEAAYASTVQVDLDCKLTSVMHARGHDVHMTVWLGTLRFLVAHKDSWKSSILFVAQCSEETGQGAKLMLEDGLYTHFLRPNIALAWHTSAELLSNTVGFRKG